MHTAPVFQPARSKYLVFTADVIIPFFIIIAVLTLGYLALYSPLFKVQTVTCTVDFVPCQNSGVTAELDKLIGQNIFKLVPSEVKKRLTSGDFTIREAQIRRQLPGHVEVALQSVYPHVALQVKDDPQWIVLDTQFRVIGSRASFPNVPTVIVPGPLTLTVGVIPSDQLIVESLGLARKLFDELVSVKAITLVGEDAIEITLDTGVIAILSPKRDLSEQLRALQAVLSDATIWKGKSVIDVRFTHPVLR